MNQIGFIGVGNMGGTLAKIAVSSLGAGSVLVSSRTLEKAQRFAEETGCTAVSNCTLAGTAQMIFLGVKPQKMAELFSEIAPILKARTDRFLLVSMAAALPTAHIAKLAGINCPVLRIMPNTPALVGRGVIPYCANALATAADFAALEKTLDGAGLVAPLPEALMDAAGALSGCGPAFVYMFIQSLADAAVSCGLPRKTALDYAAQTVLGAAEMVLKTNVHPEALKDAVCSPAGSTIAGVKALEDGAFRADVENAVLAAYVRSKEMAN